MSSGYVRSFHIIPKTIFNVITTGFYTSAFHGPRTTDEHLDFSLQLGLLPHIPSSLHILFSFLRLLRHDLLYTKDAEYPQPLKDSERGVRDTEILCKSADMYFPSAISLRYNTNARKYLHIFVICPPHWFFLVRIRTGASTTDTYPPETQSSFPPELYWSMSAALSPKDAWAGRTKPIHRESIRMVIFMFFPINASTTPQRQEPYQCQSILY